jgi:hypothetical protein
MSFRPSLARLMLVPALAAVLLLAAAPIAFAATGEPTLGLTALQAKLTASPTKSLSGYMKTVLSGSTIETIPVEVLAVTKDSPTSTLIMFRASGPKIDAIGGIASGMSGSPIYVDDAGVWKVIGAVSYGDFFTAGGTGLATPIESMLQLVSDYAPRVLDLSKPVMVSGQLIDRVIVSSTPEKLSAASASGAFVARPLASVFIGGLRPGSGAYDRLVSDLTKRGIGVTKISSRLSAGDASFSTELEPGAAVAALAARGDMWVGGVGTVTYTDGNTVLAYGHPAYWNGTTSLYMCNAWIAGVWPSIYEPYKMGEPEALRGTFTQDRNAGIMGRLGDTPAEAHLTAEVLNTDTGHAAGSSVWISSAILDTNALGGAAGALTGAAVSSAGYQVFDTGSIPGSANTTTTVVVRSAGHDYTVVIPNVYDNGFDVVSAMTEDADWAVSQLVSVLSYGLETPHIVSVDLQAQATTRRRNARIVDVNALAPLHVGENAVRVSLLAYGLGATQTVDATVTIPEDSALTGQLVATCFNAMDDGSGMGDPGTAPVTRDSVADIVGQLNAGPAYNTVFVEFAPASDTAPSGPGGGSGVISAGSADTIETSASTPWYLDGSATTVVTEISASAEPITYGDDAYVTGGVTGPTAPVEVRVYGVPAGALDEELLATGMAEMVDGTLTFEVPVSGLTSSGELRLAVDGGPGYTPAEAFVEVTVRGRVRISANPKTVFRGSWVFFTATVGPSVATGTIKFQYYDAHHKKWRTLISKRLARTGTSARATCWWRPTIRGSYKVRAVYSGDWDLGGATSSSVTIKVR